MVNIPIQRRPETNSLYLPVKRIYIQPALSKEATIPNIAGMAMV